MIMETKEKREQTGKLLQTTEKKAILIITN